ncbi:MAG: hypothetical protein KDA22_15305 [Phycisphaerales bacterium]|nr:hypothetical protein [Phycisphaerales bacterium]
MPASSSSSALATIAAIGLVSALATAGDPCPCLGDFNHDGDVNGADLGLLLGQWGPGADQADLNGDQQVDGADLGLLLALWGPCAPPSNDLCGGATPLAGSEVLVEFCTVGATDSASSEIAGCDGDTIPIHKDVWYSYTAEAEGILHVDTCLEAFDTVLAVYGNILGDNCACPGGQFSFASLLGCNDDFCGNRSQVEIPAVAGKCYTIRLGGYFTAPGTGILDVVNIHRGDRWDVCKPLPSALFQSVDGTNAGDTWLDGGQSGCAAGDTVDEWYCFTMPCDGTLTIDTCNPATNFDTTLAVYLASAPDEPVACNDDAEDPACDANPLSSRVFTGFASGTQILIRVSGFNGAAGNFKLTIDVDCVG